MKSIIALLQTTYGEKRRLSSGRSKPRRSRGQAVVEMALLSIFLGMLLAAAVDFGRAYYTAVVVENMAGEGAAYAAKYPALDSASPTCSRIPVEANQNIQDRARRVATDRGLIIRQPTQADVAIRPAVCGCRTKGTPVEVTVTYKINDLFIPGLLGMKQITIRKSASAFIGDGVPVPGPCLGP